MADCYKCRYLHYEGDAPDKAKELHCLADGQEPSEDTQISRADAQDDVPCDSFDSGNPRDIKSTWVVADTLVARCRDDSMWWCIPKNADIYGWKPIPPIPQTEKCCNCTCDEGE